MKDRCEKNWGVLGYSAPMAVPGQKVCSRCYSQLSDILKEPREYKLFKSFNPPKTTIILPGKTDSNLSDTDNEIHAIGARLTQEVEHANLKIFICENLTSVFYNPLKFPISKLHNN